MRQTKRRFVALSTALAMALVLVASLVPSIGARAADYNRINNLAFDFTSPNAGDSVTLGGDSGYDPSMIPAISTSTEGMKHDDTWPTDPIPGGRFVNSSFNSLQDYYDAAQSGNPEDALFVGTFESGKTYKAVVWGNADTDAGYALADDVNVTVNGATIVDKSIENELGDQFAFSGAYMLISFTIGGDDPSPTPDPTPSSDVPTIDNGSTVEVAPAEDGTVTFRFEKDLEYFENGGKLFIDGQEVPADMYKATRGSTIITLFKEYAAKLADGAEHAVKVVFNNGETVEGKLVVKAASSDSSASTAANGTSGTASSTAATTTKVTSPKTADVLPIAGIALVFVGATAIGVIAIRRKNS